MPWASACSIITGADPAAAHHGSRLATKLKVAGVDVAAMGLKEPERPDDLQVDPAEGYYVPCIPLDKPQLMAEIRARGLRSPSAVFAALATGGVEHAGSKMALASLLKMMWGEQYIDERDASTTGCTPTSSATGPSRWCRRSPAVSPLRRNCGRSPTLRSATTSGGPLADGLIDGQQVICPLHNHAFRLADGQCTTGEAPVRAYRVSVDNGEIVIHL